MLDCIWYCIGLHGILNGIGYWIVLDIGLLWRLHRIAWDTARNFGHWTELDIGLDWRLDIGLHWIKHCIGYWIALDVAWNGCWIWIG